MHWPECKSTANTRCAPASVSRFAVSLAAIDSRPRFFRSARAYLSPSRRLHSTQVHEHRPIVRNHRCDGTGRGTTTGVDHDQQFHEMIVDRRTGGLDQKDIAAANGLLYLNIDLPICKSLGLDRPQIHSQIMRHLLRETLQGMHLIHEVETRSARNGIGRSRKEFQFAEGKLRHGRQSQGHGRDVPVLIFPSRQTQNGLAVWSDVDAIQATASISKATRFGSDS